MATRTTVNRQVRGFALVWTAITLIIGAATFLVIYLNYGGNPNLGQGVSIPLAVTDPPEAVVAVSTNTPSPVPTQPAASPTEQSSVSIAQAAETEETPPTATPTPLPVDDTDFAVGIQVQHSISFDPEIQNLWMNDVEQLGLNWIKQQIRWEEFELSDGEYDWAVLDLVLPIAAERGIKVLLSVVTTPDWARQPGVDLEAVGPPADPQQYADFLVAMLDRYPGMIHAIEVWNEQNLAREWTSSNGLSAADYVTLLRVSYQAVKEVDPGVIVVSGALSPTGGWAEGGVVTAIDDFDYLDQLISAGMLNYADCVGAHHNGYNISPSVTWDNVPADPSAQFRGPFDNPHHSWSFRSTLQTYANKIGVAGGDQRLCVTEFGWPSVEDLDGFPQGFEFAVDNTLDEQAEWLIDAINNMEQWDIVWLAFIWNLNYGPQAGWSTESDNTPYSLIGPDWARRPAYEAISQWSAQRREQSGS